MSGVLPTCTLAMFWKILNVLFFFKTQMLSELRLLPAEEGLLAVDTEDIVTLV